MNSPPWCLLGARRSLTMTEEQVQLDNPAHYFGFLGYPRGHPTRQSCQLLCPAFTTRAGPERLLVNVRLWLIADSFDPPGASAEKGPLLTQIGLFDFTSEPYISSIIEVMLSCGSQQGELCTYGAFLRGTKAPQGRSSAPRCPLNHWSESYFR